MVTFVTPVFVISLMTLKFGEMRKVKLLKNSNIIIRVSEREKEEIKKKAESLQMSVSEYLLYLHRKEPH